MQILNRTGFNHYAPVTENGIIYALRDILLVDRASLLEAGLSAGQAHTALNTAPNNGFIVHYKFGKGRAKRIAWVPQGKHASFSQRFVPSADLESKINTTIYLVLAEKGPAYVDAKGYETSRLGDLTQFPIAGNEFYLREDVDHLLRTGITRDRLLQQQVFVDILGRAVEGEFKENAYFSADGRLWAPLLLQGGLVSRSEILAPFVPANVTRAARRQYTRPLDMALAKTNIDRFFCDADGNVLEPGAKGTPFVTREIANAARMYLVDETHGAIEKRPSRLITPYLRFPPKRRYAFDEGDDLLHGLHQGDIEALDAIYCRTFSAVRARVLRRSRDECVTDEVTYTLYTHLFSGLLRDFPGQDYSRWLERQAVIAVSRYKPISECPRPTPGQVSELRELSRQQNEAMFLRCQERETYVRISRMMGLNELEVMYHIAAARRQIALHQPQNLQTLKY